MLDIWASKSLVPIIDIQAMVGGGGGGVWSSSDEEAMMAGFFQSAIYVPHRFLCAGIQNSLF